MSKAEITANDLGLKLVRKEREIFKWFLASYLFGKRIQHNIAKQTYDVFMKHGVDSPTKIASQSYDQLIELLGEGNFRRYDVSTAKNLLEMAKELTRSYHGSILTMFSKCTDANDFESKLMKLKGVGPKTTEIFMREVRPILVKP